MNRALSFVLCVVAFAASTDAIAVAQGTSEGELFRSDEAPSEKPNILLIVSEDNGPELGCYGDLYVKTPVLDKLAELKHQFAEWRTRSNDPLLDPDNLRRLQSEIEACIADGEADKSRLTLTYPDYFL